MISWNSWIPYAFLDRSRVHHLKFIFSLVSSNIDHSYFYGYKNPSYYDLQKHFFQNPVCRRRVMPQFFVPFFWPLLKNEFLVSVLIFLLFYAYVALYKENDISDFFSRWLGPINEITLEMQKSGDFLLWHQVEKSDTVKYHQIGCFKKTFWYLLLARPTKTFAAQNH